MAFGERLTLAIKELGHSKNSFSELLGYKNNSLIYDYTRETKGGSMPGFEFFERLVQAKTGIRLEWLFTGEGDMMDKKPTPATKSDEAGVNSEIEELKGLLKQALKNNAALIRSNSFQAESIRNFSIGKVVEQG